MGKGVRFLDRRLMIPMASTQATDSDKEVNNC